MSVNPTQQDNNIQVSHIKRRMTGQHAKNVTNISLNITKSSSPDPLKCEVSSPLVSEEDTRPTKSKTTTKKLDMAANCEVILKYTILCSWCSVCHHVVWPRSMPGSVVLRIVDVTLEAVFQVSWQKYRKTTKTIYLIFCNDPPRQNIKFHVCLIFNFIQNFLTGSIAMATRYLTLTSRLRTGTRSRDQSACRIHWLRPEFHIIHYTYSICVLSFNILLSE